MEKLLCSHPDVAHARLCNLRAQTPLFLLKKSNQRRASFTKTQTINTQLATISMNPEG